MFEGANRMALKMKKFFRKLVNSLPYISNLVRQNRELNEVVKTYNALSCYPPGHFYSPIVNIKEIQKFEDQIWLKNILNIKGIQLNIENQLNNIKNFSKYYNELPFKAYPQPNLRYYFNNSYFNTFDGIILYSFIREYKPERIIEIGSGFSSALMMDTNQHFVKDEIEIKFIEPYPDRIKSLMNSNDKKGYTIIESNVQKVPIEVFMELCQNDILFIDSTHVCKTGSDVNYLLFSVIPNLKRGVLIHFHDIFYSFEYPKEWVYQGRNWNENYLVKAFLMYNTDFQIEFFNSFIFSNYHSQLLENLPLASEEGGGSLWLRKIK